MVTTVPFRSPIQKVLFLPFQNGKSTLFTVETVGGRNGTCRGYPFLLHLDPVWLRRQNRTMPKESATWTYIHLAQYLVLLLRALLRMSLPLPGKIVTTDFSPCDNEGARGVSAGRAGGE